MAKNTKKDSEMAADLRKRKVKRTVMRCPICHKEIGLANAYGHIAFHNS
jgi:hypothetical protein